MASFSWPCKIATVAAIASIATAALAAEPKALVDARAKARTEFPACTAKSPNIEGARGAHKAAKEFFESGAYQRAIRSWGDAYEFDCTKPEVFRNISNAYEKLADRSSALALLELYLEREPNPDPNARTKAENLLREVQAEEDARAKSVAPTATTTSSAAPTTTPTTPPSGSYDGPEEERPFGPAPWIVFGAGIALAGGGVPLLIVGEGKLSDAETKCPDRDACDDPAARDLGNDGITFRGIGIALTATGGAAIVGGLLWQFLGNQPRPVNASWVLPVVGDGHAGVVAGGTF